MRKSIDKVTEILTSFLMIAMVLVACWQVFTRFILNSPSVISEEFLRYALIWLTMVGAAEAYGKNKHLAVLFVARKFAKRTQTIIYMLVDVSVVAFSILIMIQGGIRTFQNAMGQVSSAMQLPMEYLYLSLPVGGVLFLFHAIVHIIMHIQEIKKDKN